MKRIDRLLCKPAVMHALFAAGVASSLTAIVLHQGGWWMHLIVLCVLLPIWGFSFGNRSARKHIDRSLGWWPIAITFGESTAIVQKTNGDLVAIELPTGIHTREEAIAYVFEELLRDA